MADVATAPARRVLGAELNATMGTPYRWLPDNSGFIVARVVPGRGAAPAAVEVPAGPDHPGERRAHGAGAHLPGPAAERGRRGAVRALLHLAAVPRAAGRRAAADLGQPGIFFDFDLSPNGRTCWSPGSSAPTATSCPRTTSRGDRACWTLRRQRRSSRSPTSRSPTTCRRPSTPCTRVRATSSGAPTPPPRWPGPRRRTAAIRAATRPCATACSCWTRPSPAQPTRLIDLEHRFSGIWWGAADLALVTSRWWNTRWEKRFAITRPTPPPRRAC